MPIDTLDHIVGPKRSVAYAKIDAQGYDADVVMGAKSLMVLPNCALVVLTDLFASASSSAGDFGSSSRRNLLRVAESGAPESRALSCSTNDIRLQHSHLEGLGNTLSEGKFTKCGSSLER